ncbi:unnamed protein product [Meloidogyne enterolobii]|uniref:Uncharacterized protein n=1 Tax=Meloidogyne enterolobii TaxID=390850 RepID=A0ACB0ZNY1_MELEN
MKGAKWSAEKCVLFSSFSGGPAANKTLKKIKILRRWGEGDSRGDDSRKRRKEISFSAMVPFRLALDPRVFFLHVVLSFFSFHPHFYFMFLFGSRI